MRRAAVIPLVFLVACGPSNDRRDEPEPGAGVDLFVNQAAETGLDFHHFHGAAGDFYLAEVTAGGVALFDYDNDGDLDAFLTQGAMLPPGRDPAEAEFPWRGDGAPRDRLFANRLQETGELRFEDVTEASGIDGPGYGMGAATGDFDNDGHLDLYVTNLEGNDLWLNQGDGTFRHVIDTWGGDDRRWSVPATVFDFNRDGLLDLFVGNYVDLDIDNPRQCFRVTGARDYCGPLAYTEVGDSLFVNRGDRFEDVTREIGLHRAFGSALGSVFLDADGDPWPDLYVANDGRPNQLWLNREGRAFEDEALMRGAALNAEGQAEASMGVIAADLDQDRDEDLFMAHLAGETNTLYRNDGRGYFLDTTIAAGMAAVSKWATGFGALALDYDNDGDLDVLVVNGAVQIIEDQANRGVPYPLRMRNQLFENRDGVFHEISDRAGEAFAALEVSRGAAGGDVDNDGDTDVLILNSNGPAELLINQTGQDRRWVGVRLLTPVRESVRDAIGARAILRRSDGVELLRTVQTTGSFASASDPRLLFGLGDAEAVDVTVTWVSGRRERFSGLAERVYQDLREGEGDEVR